MDRQRRGAARTLEAVAAADVVGVSEVGGREDARKEHIKQCVQNFRQMYDDKWYKSLDFTDLARLA